MFTVVKPIDDEEVDRRLQRYLINNELDSYYRTMIVYDKLDLSSLTKETLDKILFNQSLGNLMVYWSFQYMRSTYIEKLEEMGYGTNMKHVEELDSKINNMLLHDSDRLRTFILWIRDRYNIIEYNHTEIFLYRRDIIEFILLNFNVDVTNLKNRITEKITNLVNILEIL